jgi:hypothetical protein
VRTAMQPYANQTIDAALRKKIDTQVLAPLGLNYYDYHISQSWWLQEISNPICRQRRF